MPSVVEKADCNSLGDFTAECTIGMVYVAGTNALTHIRLLISMTQLVLQHGRGRGGVDISGRYGILYVQWFSP